MSKEQSARQQSEHPEPVLSAESAGAAPGRGRLVGKHIVVVGAGTRPSDDADAPMGNGRAIAVLAAREGASVACVDIDRAAAERTAELVRTEGGEAVVIHADVSDADDCARLVAESVAAFGGLDGVVANVGIGLGAGLSGTSVVQWDAVFDENIRAHFLIAKAALPILGNGGSIVLVSSIAGLKPGSRLPAYDSSKAAVFGLCRHIAMEGARAGVRANVVGPDWSTRRSADSRPPADRRVARLVCRCAAKRRPGTWPTRRCSC